MEAIPAQIAMQMAITQKNAAMGMIKQSAQMQQQIVDMLSVAASSRGGNLNITA